MQEVEPRLGLVDAVDHGIRSAARRVEQVEIVIGLLDHPNNDEDNNVKEVFLDEETPDGGGYTWPVQPAIAVDRGVDSHDDIQG